MRSTPFTAPAGAALHDRLDTAAAAREAAAARVKQHGLFAAGVQHAGDLGLCLMDQNARGTGAALLVAVRIAEQHALAPPACLQMPAVERIGKQLLQGGAAAAERLLGLELRRDIERDLAGVLVVGGRPVCQQQRREHVIGPGGAADDEVADGIGSVAMSPLHDGVEHRERALAERIELRYRPAVLLQRLGQQVAPLAPGAREPLIIGKALPDDLVQHARLLAHIERCQVKAEGVDAPQQALDVEQPGVGALVGLEARGDERHIVAELARQLVTVGAAVEGPAQPFADLREEHPVGHAVVARGRDGAGARQQRHVVLEPLDELGGGRDAARALREPLRELLTVLEIGVDDRLLLAREGFADRLGVHVRVAVHVPAGPGAEVQNGRHPRRAALAHRRPSPAPARSPRRTPAPRGTARR